VHWSKVGDPRAPDTDLMRWALANGYAVFTHDLDFGTMLALSGADGPSVLQVRCLNVLPDAIGPLVLSLLMTYAAEIEQGALVVADERRERVRILPLNRQG
jgi:predicted nuclease of predicted toxin-antitoxin system